ncbi:MAG: hypothetical protein ACK5LC_16710 [Coprobacillaceae bacterium]
MLTFIRKIVNGQKKVYLIMCTVLSLLSCFEFVVLSMYTNSSQGDFFSQSMIRIVPSIAVFVSFFLILFINNFFVNSKTEEFSIIILSGRNLKQILKYIFIQFGTMYIFTSIIGMGLGIGLLYGINFVLGILNSNVVYIFDFMQTLYFFLAFLGLKLIYIILLNQGKFIRIQADIVNYLKQDKEEASKPNPFSDYTSKKKKKFPVGRCLSTVFAIFLMIISINEILNNITDIYNTIIFFCISLLAEVMIINSTLPLLFDILHDRYLLKHPVLLMALTQLMDMSKVMASIININATIIPIIFAFLLLPEISEIVSVTIVLCFFIIMIMMILSFFVRFAVYLPTKAEDIAVLKAIRYQKKQIDKMQRIGIICFLLFIIGIPIILYGIVLYQGYVAKLIELSLIYLLAGSYIILYIALCSYMIISYKRLTKEVVSDVKYLNRSE